MAGARKGIWPRAESASELIACEYCDVLQGIREVEEGASVHCANCGERLYQNRPRSLQRSISYSLAAVVFMILVLLFPFLSMSNTGLKSSMSVWGSVIRLWQEGDQAMAVGVAAFTIVMPILLITWLLYVSVPLLFNQLLPFSIGAFKAVTFLKNWTMVEVFFLGTIVSLLKLVKLADVEFGVGFWAFGGLMIALTGAVANIDRHEFWDRIEWILETQAKNENGHA